MSLQLAEHPITQSLGLKEQRIWRRMLIVAGKPPHLRGVMLQRGVSDVRRVGTLSEVQRLLRDHGHPEIWRVRDELFRPLRGGVPFSDITITAGFAEPIGHVGARLHIRCCQEHVGCRIAVGGVAR